jgi:hypothetical protein
VRKEIGKIKDVYFGMGGYQDVCIGVTFHLGSDKQAWGVNDFWGTWGTEHRPDCKWTEESRVKHLGEMVMSVKGLLRDAKVTSLDGLKGIPVEVTFDGNALKGWRILTEVI